VKKVVFYIVVLGLLVAALCYEPVQQALFNFVFLGIVPGTHYVLPFWAIASLSIFVTIVLLVWLSRQSMFIGESKKAVSIQTKTEAANTAPKARRRYQPVTSTSSSS